MELREIVLVGNRDAEGLGGWLARHDLVVHTHEETPEKAIATVQGGHADAVVVVEGDWIRLLAPLHAAPPDGALPSAPAALAMTGIGSGAVSLIAGVTGAAAAGRAARAGRSRRRRRPGRPRSKPSRAALELIADLAGPPDNESLRAIAEQLDRQPHLRLPQGGKWHPTTVRRALDAGIEETTIVLRRVGAILAEIDARDSVTATELRELGEQHAFHSDRLWQAFRTRDPAELHTPFVPPLQRRGRSRFELSSGGRDLLRVWQRSQTLDDRVEGVLLDIARAAGAGAGVSPAAFEVILQQHAVPADAIPETYLDYRRSGGLFALTPEGREVAATWDRLVNPDPRRRLDADFWPTAAQEAALAPTWDWNDPLPVSDGNE